MVAKLALLRGIGQEESAALERQARRVHIARGEALVRRGERFPGFCALLDGALKLSISRRSELVLALVAAGDTFGEAAALRRCPSPCDAVAVEDSEVTIIALGAIERLARNEPRFARALIDLLAQRVLELQAELEASLLQRAPQRLASYLCSLASNSGSTVTLPVSKTLLASILGIKKETLSRLLRDLAEQRLIEVSRREVTLLDRQRLGELTA